MMSVAAYTIGTVPGSLEAPQRLEGQIVTKRILSVGFEFPGDVAASFAFQSDQSLLDADIIVFQPDISDYVSIERYQNKPLLTENGSFELVEDSSRWRFELMTAVEAGKTIFVYLSQLEQVFVHTGEKQFSGTGRNRQTTNIVRPHNNYSAIPLDLGRIVAARGKEIRVARDLKFLAPYWSEFGAYSTYEVYLEGQNLSPILTTKTGGKVIGAVVTIDGASGCFILLPPIREWPESSFEYDEEEDDNVWTKTGIAFMNRLSSALVDIDRAVRGNRETTPPPAWTRRAEYQMKREATLQKKVSDATKKIEQLQATRSSLNLELLNEGNLRGLLYETGRPLEDAILEALSILGFEAERYEDGESEFDAVFSSPEGRFLGEAEGRDNRAIAIDKLSQLERNLQEDFAREEVSDFAKGVLFGNAFRLRPLDERTEFFTEKCFTSAKRAKVVLVRTTDLFRVAKHLKENKSEAFARKCRESLMATEGEVVVFPEPPSSKRSGSTTSTTAVKD
jgi:hypothetical protein